MFPINNCQSLTDCSTKLTIMSDMSTMSILCSLRKPRLSHSLYRSAQMCNRSCKLQPQPVAMSEWFNQGASTGTLEATSFS